MRHQCYPPAEKHSNPSILRLTHHVMTEGAGAAADAVAAQEVGAVHKAAGVHCGCCCRRCCCCWLGLPGWRSVLVSPCQSTLLDSESKAFSLRQEQRRGGGCGTMVKLGAEQRPNGPDPAPQQAGRQDQPQPHTFR